MGVDSTSGSDALRQLIVRRMDGFAGTDREDTVIVEAPVALSYNGRAHAVMMATPEHLEDFALGFSLSEAVVADATEWQLVEVRRSDQGIHIDMHIPQVRFDALGQRRRQMVGSSACGVCGTEMLQPFAMSLPGLPMEPESIDIGSLHRSLRKLVDAQSLNRISGGVHAAASVHAGGLLVREDVGRHNALDKLIGARARTSMQDGFAVVSSRASWELVHKCVRAGIPLLAAVSAPTSAAIDLADRCGLTLIAFARDQSMNVYTHASRLGGVDPSQSMASNPRSSHGPSV